MGVTIGNGDIFSTQSQVIGHSVNTQGAMGSGFARSIRLMYPSVFNAYLDACDNGILYGGQCLMAVAEEYASDSLRVVANIASQVTPGANARLDLLGEGLDNMFLQMKSLGLSSVALPRAGLMVGGLQQDEVLYVVKQTATLHPDVDAEVWGFMVE